LSHKGDLPKRREAVSGGSRGIDSDHFSEHGKTETVRW